MTARSPSRYFARHAFSVLTLAVPIALAACGRMSDVVAPRQPADNVTSAELRPSAVTATSSQTVVTFEDLPDPFSLHLMWPHVSLHGITFASTSRITHYDNEVYGHPHSGLVFVFNGEGSDNEAIAFETPVVFDGAWVGSPHDLGGEGNKEFWFEGYLNETKVGESSHTALIAGAPMQYVAPGFPGPVDKVVMRRNYGWWVMDDITYSEVVVNQPPVAAIGGNAGGPPADHYEGTEGTAITLDASGSSDPEGGTLGYDWDLDNDGQYDDATGVSVAHAFADNGAFTIGLRVTDSSGLASTDSTSVMVGNVAPSASFGNDGPVEEGSAFVLSLTEIADPSSADVAAGFEFAFDCGSGYGAFSTASTLSCATTDNGTLAVQGKVRDKDGGATEYSASAMVTNAPPSLGPITITGDPTPVGTLITASASFTDPGSADTHTGDVRWNSGDSFGPAAPGVSQPTKDIVATSAALPAGVYTVMLRVTDDDGGSDTRTAESYVVVYDPSGRFVTGGGWFNSPASACASILCPTFSGAGRVTFGFVSNQDKSGSAARGESEFNFRAGGMRFKSSAYESLQVAGSHAQYRGAGTVNDVGGYSFLITLTDGQSPGGGGVDKIRLKIWNADGVVYDNQRNASGSSLPDDLERGTPLGGGSVVVHN
jgi:PKD repeat protein